MPAHRPTLVSLAAELGVSRQTVSNVLNRPSVVAEPTRSRVAARIRAAGYIPSRAGRHLRTRRSQAIGVRLMPTFDGINGHIGDTFLHELAEHAHRAGYRLALFAAANDDDEIATYDRMLRSNEIDGVVLTSTRLDDPRIAWLVGHDVPFVSFGRPWRSSGEPAPATHDWVDVDGSAGTEAVTRHLIGLGHVSIGYLSWPARPDVSGDRLAGWRRAMRAKSCDVDLDALTAECSDDVTDARRATEALLQRGVSAIVCASDTLALGAHLAVEALAPSLPRVSIVGFDDTPVARALGLSSVAQPAIGAARTSVSMLVSRLAGRRSPEHVLLRPSPVYRDPESVTPANSLPIGNFQEEITYP
ncbi:MAG TPA: LacI family DNA-binding transcriptional regulator [Candidatus Limnocylindria bacterium]|nr:LacI family DNA-binding transcriptional regulator [Candidatus Limnocylindria bacterium]